MKKFDKVCAQGDILIMKIDALPANAVKTENPESVGGSVIITHSETGHHHVMERAKVEVFTLPDSIMDLLLVVKEETSLEHLRGHDTHEPILFTPGTYHVRRQREHTPEGYRRVAD